MNLLHAFIKPFVGTQHIRILAKHFLVSFNRREQEVFIFNLFFHHVIMMNIFFAGLRYQNFVAKFNRFPRFATNDLLGMLFKQAIELFVGRDFFTQDNAAMGLVNDSLDQRKIMA